MVNNPFKKSEVDKAVLELLKDSATQKQYLFQVFLLNIVERLTFAALVAMGSTALALLVGE